MQGEADKWETVEYKKAFELFAKDIRRDIGTITNEDLRAMPIIVGEISRTSGSAMTSVVNANSNFITMQQSLANLVENVFVINSSILDINKLVDGTNQALGTDNWHYNQKDMFTLGNLVGKCILENILKA